MKMPELTGKQLCSIAEHIGFVLEREHGSHAIFSHPDGRTAVIPMHDRPLGKGLIDNIVKHDFKMEKQEFERIVEEHEENIK